MQQGAIGGNVRYPNLQGIADLFRARINDTSNNAGGAGTGSGNAAGLIMYNQNPDLITFMDSAIQETYSDLRNVGDPQLILDNYILTGLPPVNSDLGPGVANPTAQVSIAYNGYFDGVQWYPQFPLPISVSRVLSLAERQTGTFEDFVPIKATPFGLPHALQGIRQNQWEMRQGQIWMPGSTVQTDINIRARINYPEFINLAPQIAVNSNIFSVAYVPLLDSKNAIVAKMMVEYAIRFSPESYQMAIAEESRMMDKLKLEAVRQMQANENERNAFGDEAVQDFAVSWAWL